MHRFAALILLTFLMAIGSTDARTLIFLIRMYEMEKGQCRTSIYYGNECIGKDLTIRDCLGALENAATGMGNVVGVSLEDSQALLSGDELIAGIRKIGLPPNARGRPVTLVHLQSAFSANIAKHFETIRNENVNQSKPEKVPAK